MRGKKVVNNNPIIYANPLKLEQARPHNKYKLKDVKSLESKFNNNHPINHQKKHNPQPTDKKSPIIIADCEIITKNRENHNYIPINKPFY
jgi:hypothetical protein